MAIVIIAYELTHALLKGVNSSDLVWLSVTAKYSTTRSIARPFGDN